MKDLIKKYEELLEVLESNSSINNEYKESRITTIKEVLEDIKEHDKNQFNNPERLTLKRLVSLEIQKGKIANEIETPRKKYGTSKMNTLFTLQEKLKK